MGSHTLKWDVWEDPDEAGDIEPLNSDKFLTVEVTPCPKWSHFPLLPVLWASPPTRVFAFPLPEVKGLTLPCLRKLEGPPEAIAMLDQFDSPQVPHSLTPPKIRCIDYFIDFKNCSFYLIVFKLQDIKEKSKCYSRTLPPFMGKQLVCFWLHVGSL